MILKSSVKASELIKKIKDTLELNTPPSDEVIYDILNRFIFGLYSGVIYDVREAMLEKNEMGQFALSGNEWRNISPARVCDVVKVMCMDYEYERVEQDYPARLCGDDEHLYKIWDTGGFTFFPSEPAAEEIRVYIRAVPPLHTPNDDREIELPDEFMNLAEAKLYSEIYRLLGEDDLCANWTEEYNMIMSRFGAWLEVHKL